jgi:hypothetical protein
MKRRRSSPLEDLKRRVSATDADVIDELYGLEPVYEPDEPGRSSRFSTEWVSVRCPYCWERFETQVDLSGGSFSHIEDCQVCCRPIELHCDIDADGRLLSVRPDRMD